MKRNEGNHGTRKKIQQYSYSLSNGIGKGYSSQVYRGKHDGTEEEVAIKVIDMRMLKGEVHKNLLAAEIEVLKGLRNAESVIELYEVYNTKNNTYIITELCEGGDLAKVLLKKTIPEGDAITYMKQIILGYSNMHRNNIIHRDLKPANILLKNGQAKIADFGFAMKSSDGRKYCSYNVGSPIYMPPEALNQNKYSFKSDIWALGVIFYEMLTGKTPWKAKTEKELGKMLSSVSIKKLMPKNIGQQSISFLMKTLDVDCHSRMCPEELIRFIFNDGSSIQSVSLGRRQDRSGIQQKVDNRETSLTKNSLNTPKNGKMFNMIKGTDDCKNGSLPKTAATIASGKQHQPALSSNSITGMSSAQSYQSVDKKAISKQLLSQVHFCRFLYKLLGRIEDKINGNVSEALKEFMSLMIFGKLEEVKALTLLDGKAARQYKQSQDYDKIAQIIMQYQSKYQKDLSPPESPSDLSAELQIIQSELSSQILKMYSMVKFNPEVDQVKEEVIVLDYLVTLRQLISLMQNNGLEGFHSKSKMEAIVEGAPSRNITKEHIRAISAKLRAIKLL